MADLTAESVASAMTAELVANATKAAATAAAEVLITAAKATAVIASQSGDHDALTRLQGQVEAMNHAAGTNHTTLLLAVAEVKQTVLAQNGRIGKLETWKTQASAIYGVILFLSPFMFYALTRWFGG